MRYTHVVIVHDDRQHVSWRPVTSEKDHVVELFVCECDVAKHYVSYNRLTGLARLKPYHVSRIR